MAQAAASVAQSLRGAWGAKPQPPQTGPSSSSGARRPEPAQAAYAPSSATAPEDAPFPPEQSSWLRAAISDAISNAVGSSLESFGQHLDVQLNNLRSDVAAARFEASEASAVALGTRETAQEHERRLSNLAARFDELERLTRLSATSSTASEQPSIPYEKRQLAVIGSLGWDSPPEQFLERAMETLQRAGVAASAYSHVAPLVPAHGRGSGAEVFFHSAAALQQARIAVRSARVSFVPNRFAWLDAKRERSENAPARIIHRLHEAVVDALTARAAERGQPLPRVDKDVPGRSLRLDNQRAAYVAQLRVRWTAAGVAALTDQERSEAVAFAEAA